MVRRSGSIITDPGHARSDVMYLWRLSAILGLIGAAPAVALEHPAAQVIERGAIVWHSPRPAVDSGVVAVWVELRVRQGTAPDERMFLLWGGGDQIIPSIGSICRIVYSKAYIEGLGLVHP